MRIAVIGLGKVGTNAAFLLRLQKLASFMYLINRSYEKAKGIALDLLHASSLLGGGRVQALPWERIDSIQDCDLVIITAGVQRIEGQNRSDVAVSNIEIMSNISKFSIIIFPCQIPI